MSITSGFYVSSKHDRLYSAEDIGSIFDGIIEDGVYESIGEKFMVKPATGMELNVSSGRGWFNHSWIRNDSAYPVTIEASEAVLDRIDAVVIEINRSIEVRAGRIIVVKGTPSSQPTKPKLTKTRTVSQFPLAYVTVKAGVSSLTAESITNAVGTSECPFVIGVVSSMTTDIFISKWEAEFEQLYREMQEQIDQLIQGDIPDGSVSSTYNVKVNHELWSARPDGLYEANVEVVGILAKDNPILDLDIDTLLNVHHASNDEIDVELDALGDVVYATTKESYVTFVSRSQPDCNIFVKMLCVRK